VNRLSWRAFGGPFIGHGRSESRRSDTRGCGQASIDSSAALTPFGRDTSTKTIHPLVGAVAPRRGVGAHCTSGYSGSSARLWMLLDRFASWLVMDIRVNEGKFAWDLRAAGCHGHFVTTEPVAAAHATHNRAAANDARWTVGERCAVGAAVGKSTCHFAGYAVSSCWRETPDTHLVAAANLTYVAEEVASAVTRADLMRPHAAESVSSVFVKSDVEGHDRDLLKGGRNHLDTIGGFQLALCAGEAMMPAPNGFLACCGLVLWSIDRGLMNSGGGRMLRCDGTFVRESAIESR
jgi:FkbM family methyltransferase